MNKTEYHQTIVINVNPEVVYKTLTNPLDLRSWYSSNSQIALREGGHFTHSDFEGYVFESGQFLQIRPNELLYYSLEHNGFYANSKVQLTLSSRDSESTQLQFTHEQLSEMDYSYAQAQWDWALQNLKNYIETGTVQAFKPWLKANNRVL